MSITATASPPGYSLRSALRVAGWLGLALIIVIISLSDFLAAAPSGTIGIGPFLAPPSATFRFGTDILGRDMLSETLHGLSMTLQAAVPAALIALFFGGLSGFSVARLAMPIALILRWLVGMLAALPALLLAVLFIGLTTREWASLAAGLAAAPLGFVRVFDRVRRNARAVHAHYAHATGISHTTLLRRDLVYEFRQEFSTSVARTLASVTFILSTVSFLGFGMESPHRDLGLMIAASKPYYPGAWWTAAFPALALAILILFARLAAGFDEGGQP